MELSHGQPALRLADRLEGRDNNFNLIRMIAASAVLVSHAFPITLGPGAVEPLVGLTGTTLGLHAVAVFFVISGLLIARSLERSPTFVHWLTARVLRLFPGLLVVLLLTMLVLGPLVTSLPLAAYAADPATWTYVPRNLSLAFLQYPLPGVFEGNPHGPAINGSLWSLVHEVGCYAGVAIAGALGLLRRPRLFLGALTLLLAARIGMAQTGLVQSLPGLFVTLAFSFALGMAAWVWRERLVLHGALLAGLWALALALWPTPVFAEALAVALAYSTLWLAYVPRGALLAFNRLGDYSYGVYIYAFPMQQLMAHLFPGQSPLTNIALAAPPTLLCAVLSWRLVEKRALAWSRPLADRLTGRRAGTA